MADGLLNRINTAIVRAYSEHVHSFIVLYLAILFVELFDLC